jgi:predicted RNase H-like nuclease (RuvC/YqgF family)
MDDGPAYKDLFSSLRNHIKAIERVLSGLENKMDILSSEALMKQELETNKKEIRALNHIIDEHECEIHALKTKLKGAYI